MTASLTVRSIESIAEVPAAAWDACANPPGRGRGGGRRRAVQSLHHARVSSARWSNRARSAGAPAGRQRMCWSRTAGGRLVAAAPTYLKSHSQGEYVFDHGWADAYQRAGGRYYPKLQVAVPFTPVTGRRLLVARRRAERRARGADRGLARAARGGSTPRRSTSPSPIAATRRRSSAPASSSRTGEQFHFINEGYRDFDDFLAALASRKRKAIKRERREALGDDVAVELLTGSDIQVRALGRVLRVLHGHGLAQMGPPLPDPRILRPHRRGDGRRASCW